jgi:D-alanine--poly(phosphoribitol) ligase subunit 1
MSKRRYIYNLAQKFEDVASKQQHAIALKYPSGNHVSFHELNDLSDKISCIFLESGLKPGNVVAIFNQKSPLAFATMLACIKNGFIYTNVDITSPWKRVEKIISTCEPVMICTDDDENYFESEINALNNKTIFFSLKSSSFAQRLLLAKHKVNDAASINGDMPAYIMFTSGSTGTPKGAVMSHMNVLNFIEWGKQTYDISESDIFTNVNPIYFDNSVFDFYNSLFNGACMVPISHQEIKDARFTVEAITNAQCTVWFSVPSMLVYLLTTKALTANHLSSIRHFVFGGEGFAKNKLKQLYEMFGHKSVLNNVYGPTECTCICSSHCVTPADFENMNELTTLGYIAPNFDYLLMTDDADSTVGELALGGPCVGKGYYNDPVRTAASFIQHPHAGYNKLIYKTGDLVERKPNGHLHFRGRVDNQVKHMGYRIELEEIEAAFNSLDVIDEVGVVYERISTDYGQIKAYIKIVDGASLDSKVVLEKVKQLLPPYMVPKHVIVLERLPKNANGKIDRKQLLEIK